MRYIPSPRRIGSAIGQVGTFVRRRRDGRKPRVRVRIAHGETRVLAEGNAERERLLSLARELVAEYGKASRARP
jgi:hypothetical protein